MPGAEVGALAAALERSRTYGSPLAEQLHLQATALRRDARRRLEEQAARAAPKIQLVVALVLVPSVLLTILAAIVAHSDALLGQYLNESFTSRAPASRIDSARAEETTGDPTASGDLPGREDPRRSDTKSPEGMAAPLRLAHAQEADPPDGAIDSPAMHASAGEHALRGGIDLGGTKIQAAIVSPGGDVSGEARRQTPTEGGPADVAAEMAKALVEAAEAAGVQTDSLAGIGVGSPGDTNEKTGDVAEARNLPGWEGSFPLGPTLAEALGTQVRIGNDVDVATEAEFKLGSGKPYGSILGVFWGTGVGGGLILDGKRWTGRGAAGEIGHMVVKDGGRHCPCGRRGCMEAYAGRGAMEQRARKLHDEGRKTKLFEIMEERDRDRLTSGIWERALDHHDDLAEELIGEALEALGAGVASAVNLLDVEAVIIGGGLGVRFGDPYVEKIAKHMHPAPVRRRTPAGDARGRPGRPRRCDRRLAAVRRIELRATRTPARGTRKKPAASPRAWFERRGGRQRVLLIRQPRLAPGAVAREQVARCLGAPGSGVVGLDLRRVVEQRLDDAPGLVDRVEVREQLRVAAQRVAEQALVRLRLLGVLLVEEQVEVDPVEGVLARLLRHQADLGPGLGLHPDDQLVGVGDHPPADPEPRRALEHDPDLGRLDRHRLAGADVERHPGPAPVVDLELQRDEGLGVGTELDPVDLLVAAVLAAEVAGRVGRGHRPEQVGAPVADRVGVGGPGGRRLHRHEARICSRWFWTTSRSAPTGS